MASVRYYFDTSSILDLEDYDLTKRLRKVDSIIVPEVLDEIRDRSLKRRQVPSYGTKVLRSAPRLYRVWTPWITESAP